MYCCMIRHTAPLHGQARPAYLQTHYTYMGSKPPCLPGMSAWLSICLLCMCADMLHPQRTTMSICPHTCMQYNHTRYSCTRTGELVYMHGVQSYPLQLHPHWGTGIHACSTFIPGTVAPMHAVQSYLVQLHPHWGTGIHACSTIIPGTVAPAQGNWSN